MKYFVACFVPLVVHCSGSSLRKSRTQGSLSLEARTWRPATEAEITAFVNAHNAKRCMHEVPYVAWDAAVAANANEYISPQTGLVHSHSYNLPPPAGPAGENLFMASDSAGASPQAAVDAWYDEVNGCVGGPTGFTDGCATGANGATTGHFTAMIWKGVRTIGCAFSDQTAPQIVVCRYKADDVLNDNTPNMNKEGGNFVNHVLPQKKTGEECGDPSAVAAPTHAPAQQPPAGTNSTAGAGGGGGTTTGCVTASGAGSCTLTTNCPGQTKISFTCKFSATGPYKQYAGNSGTFTVDLPAQYTKDFSDTCESCTPITSVQSG